MKRCTMTLAFAVAVIVGMYLQVAITDARMDRVAYEMDVTEGVQQ